MSKPNVAAFWKQVEESAELRKELDSLSAGSRQEVLAGLVRIGSAHGFPFTSEELGEMARVDGVEISDGELSAVAGGAYQSFQSNGMTSRMGFQSDGFTSRMNFQFSSFRVSFPRGF